MMEGVPINALEASLAIESTGPSLWAAVASPAYEANSGTFGGWTAALLLKTVLSEAESTGSASAMTVNFVKRVVPGAPLELRTTRLGGGRSLTHWRCDMLSDGGLLAIATVVLADRKASSAYTELKMPEAPPPAGFEPADVPGALGATVDIRPTLGDGVFNQPTTRTLNWERETSGRPIDAVQIAFLSDAGAPRIFYVSDAPRPSSTITLSIYFHATSEELAACGDDYILCDMVGTRANAATIASRKNMWGRSGALLATSEQLCWFR